VGAAWAGNVPGCDGGAVTGQRRGLRGGTLRGGRLRGHLVRTCATGRDPRGGRFWPAKAQARPVSDCFGAQGGATDGAALYVGRSTRRRPRRSPGTGSRAGLGIAYVPEDRTKAEWPVFSCRCSIRGQQPALGDPVGRSAGRLRAACAERGAGPRFVGPVAHRGQAARPGRRGRPRCPGPPTSRAVLMGAVVAQRPARVLLLFDITRGVDAATQARHLPGSSPIVPGPGQGESCTTPGETRGDREPVTGCCVAWRGGRDIRDGWDGTVRRRGAHRSAASIKEGGPNWRERGVRRVGGSRPPRVRP